MVYGFIKQSGGHITVYSGIGYGTSIAMYLPRLQSESTSPSEAETEIVEALPKLSRPIVFSSSRTMTPFAMSPSPCWKTWATT
jgi:hypothetical protein